MTNIFKAVQSNDLEQLKEAILQKHNLDQVDENGRTALMHASKYGYIAIAELLIENRANVDHEDEDKYTALMLALKNGHEEIAKLLIENRANLNCVDKEGRTALMIAV